MGREISDAESISPGDVPKGTRQIQVCQQRAFGKVA
jgi:hypothetical protein